MTNHEWKVHSSYGIKENRERYVVVFGAVFNYISVTFGMPREYGVRYHSSEEKIFRYMILRKIFQCFTVKKAL